jgi:hypothetical protein
MPQKIQNAPGSNRPRPNTNKLNSLSQKAGTLHFVFHGAGAGIFIDMLLRDELE